MVVPQPQPQPPKVVTVTPSPPKSLFSDTMCVTPLTPAVKQAIIVDQPLVKQYVQTPYEA